VEVISNVNAQRSAVRSIAWLGVFVAMQGDMIEYFSARFITVDYWESEDAWRAFREKFLHEYENLDVVCEQVTIREREIGRFKPA